MKQLSVEEGRWYVRTLAEVAAFFDVALVTVGVWRQEGMPGGEGAWYLPAITQWRVAKAERKHDTADESERASRRKTAAIKAARDELKLKAESGELVERSAVEGWVREAFSIIRARLQSLPGEIASGVPPDVRGGVLEEASSKVNAALRELSKRGRTD